MCHHTQLHTIFPIHWSQALALHIFWPLTLEISPLGTKPDLIFLQILETPSHGGLLGLLRALHSIFVQASLLRTVSKSLSRWDPSESVVSIHLRDKYLLNAIYWQGAVPGQMSERTEWNKRDVLPNPLIWMLYFCYYNQRFHWLPFAAMSNCGIIFGCDELMLSVFVEGNCWQFRTSQVYRHVIGFFEPK